MLTMKAKYALRAMSELARSGEQRLQAHELAVRCRAPGKFLETILVDLRTAGFVESRRGQRGGHTLAVPPEDIMIGDLIRAIGRNEKAEQPKVADVDDALVRLRTVLRDYRDALTQRHPQLGISPLEALRTLTVITGRDPQPAAQTRFDLRAGDCVRLKRSPRSLRLLHPQGYSYFAMLRQKLHWSAAPRV